MHSFAYLPRPLLLLLFVSSASLVCASARKDEAPSTAKSYLQDRELADIAKKHERIRQRLEIEVPLGVKKMSGDPAEKFFPEYWSFRPDNVDDDSLTRREEGVGGARFEDNHLQLHERYIDLTQGGMFHPPLLLHTDWQSPSYQDLRHFARDVLAERGYKCPTGTKSCTSINRGNSCCAKDQTCMIVKDTGNGDVGCCPKGSNCKGAVEKCNKAAGYKQCPDNSNVGGCCIPGYRCDDIGCVQISSVTFHTPTSVVPAGVTTRTVIKTSIVYPPPVHTIYVTTTTPTATVVVGGASTEVETITTLVTAASLPVRPTSGVAEAGTTAVIGYCPTGYYECSARFQGGCCQIGRDCHSTYCPSTASTELITGRVVTVKVPVGGGVVTVRQGGGGGGGGAPKAGAAGVTSSANTGGDQDGGVCATGWFSCAQSNGGGCCPSGYRCGSSCTATESGLPGRVNKIPPNQAAIMEAFSKWTLALGAGVLGIGMVLL